MKANIKKPLLLGLCAVVLVVVTVVGTLAYFTDNKSVSNTFTVGKVAIKLEETKTNDAGVAVTPAAKTTTGNAYVLIPGRSYLKDPTVTVEANSEDSYVFVKVENDLADIEVAGDKSGKTIAEQILANGWTQLKDAAGKDVEGVYFRVHTKSSSDVPYAVFGEFKVDPAATAEDLAAYQSDATVDISAYAIQKEGLADEKAAWAALQ